MIIISHKSLIVKTNTIFEFNFFHPLIPTHFGRGHTVE